MLRIDNTAVLLGAHDCSPDHSDGLVFQPPPAPDGGQPVVRRLEFTAPPRKTFSTDAGREKNWFFSGLWIHIYFMWIRIRVQVQHQFGEEKTYSFL